jgi:hypothetical protein
MDDSDDSMPRRRRPVVPPFLGPSGAARPSSGRPLGRAGFRPFLPPAVAAERPASPPTRPRSGERPPETAETPAWLASLDEDTGEPGAAPEAVAAAEAMLARARIGQPGEAAGPNEDDRRRSFAAAIAAAEAFAGAGVPGQAQGLAEAARALAEAIAGGGLATFGEPSPGAERILLTPEPGSGAADEPADAVAAHLEALAQRIRAGQLTVRTPGGPITDPVALVAALAALFDIQA